METTVRLFHRRLSASHPTTRIDGQLGSSEVSGRMAGVAGRGKDLQRRACITYGR